MASPVLEETALARGYRNCLTKKVNHSRRARKDLLVEQRREFCFGIDEATKIVTLVDGKKLNVRRFDDRWTSAL